MTDALAEPVLAKLPRIEPTIVLDKRAGGPRLRFSTPSLLAGLWLQFGQALGGGAVVRACAQCGQLFEAGPGKGRRLDSKYCSGPHQRAYNSLKRGKKG